MDEQKGTRIFCCRLHWLHPSPTSSKMGEHLLDSTFPFIFLNKYVAGLHSQAFLLLPFTKVVYYILLHTVPSSMKNGLAIHILFTSWPSYLQKYFPFENLSTDWDDYWIETSETLDGQWKTIGLEIEGKTVKFLATSFATVLFVLFLYGQDSRACECAEPEF